jgi:uncharacterized damage-inducible protein DinB
MGVSKGEIYMNMERLHGWHYNQFENNIKSVERIILMSDPHALTTYRDGGTGWTALEVLCHLRDFEQVFIERSRVTIEQERGALPFPNPDALAAEGRYNEQSPDAVLAEWKARRTAFLAYLRERSDADWERVALHPTRGDMTLFDQVSLSAMHDTLHMEQITRILYEKV